SGFVRTERDMADHLDNGVVGLHWVAADGIILWANRADYEPLGYTREEWVGHHAAEFHADHAALADMFQRLSQGETIYNYPARLRHKNGSLQNVLICSSVLFAMVRTKSGGESTVRPECVIRGVLFHPTRLKG